MRFVEAAKVLEPVISRREAAVARVNVFEITAPSTSSTPVRLHEPEDVNEVIVRLPVL